MIKRIAVVAIISSTLLSSLPVFAASSGTAQSAVVAEIMRSVTEIGDILQKKRAVFASSVPSNVTAAIVKAIDPHAEIMSPAEAERRAEELRGIFYGVGLGLTVRNKALTITAVTPDGPASAHNIPPGSVIDRINGKEAASLSLSEAVARLRGAKDEEVVLCIRTNETAATTNTFVIRRSIIHMPVTGVTEQWPHGLCYMKLNGLYEFSGAQVATQFVAWADEKCNGVILDLRGADGGDLQSAADVAGLFRPAGSVIFNIRDGANAIQGSLKGGVEKSFSAPVMVLINSDTSAAAEALAAALGACQGVLLIGTPTRGDGGLREFIPLSDNRVLYLATRRIEVNPGISYHGTGVAPHVSVPAADTAAPKPEAEFEEEEANPFVKVSEEEKLNRALLRRTKGDAALQRALDILLGLNALNIKGR